LAIATPAPLEEVCAPATQLSNTIATASRIKVLVPLNEMLRPLSNSKPRTEESRRRSGGLIFKNNPSLLIGALGVNRR
jgi:hypothetical protein